MRERTPLTNSEIEDRLEELRDFVMEKAGEANRERVSTAKRLEILDNALTATRYRLVAIEEQLDAPKPITPDELAEKVDRLQSAVNGALSLAKKSEAYLERLRRLQ